MRDLSQANTFGQINIDTKLESLIPIHAIFKIIKPIIPSALVDSLIDTSDVR